MSGLVKAKKFDWKDSNMALVGTDTDRRVKKESALTEPAWNGAGQKPGLQIWRIKKFKVTIEPKEDYGKFYNGDSYILLKTYKEKDSEELHYDVHFWIGSQSTQDEYGTAAYKTVELDNLLDDKPVQHREVEAHESKLFKSYFEEMTTLEGGCDSGFRHVKPEEYEIRLFHVEKKDKKLKNVSVTEIKPFQGSLNSGDVYIIDNGLQLYQWNGSKCSKDEKFKAVQYLQKLKSERHGKPKVETLDEDEPNDDDETALGLLHVGNPPDQSEVDGEVDDSFQETLFRITDASGEVTRTKVTEGSIPREALNSSDVFIADTGKELFFWIGKKASKAERDNGLIIAHNYLKTTKHPLIPVTILTEGQHSDDFEKILD